MYSEILQNLRLQKKLTTENVVMFFDAILKNEVNEAQQIAFLALFHFGLAEKPSQCLAKLVIRFREETQKIDIEGLDVVGTGGDGYNLFNVSSGVCFFTAAAGVKTCKHGNRSASSKSGASDFFEALAGPEVLMKISDTTEETGDLVYLHAGVYYPSLERLSKIRKSLKIPTIFNTLGPFSNPAKVRNTLVGVNSPHLGMLFCEALKDLGYSSAMVVYGMEGLDEISPSGETRVWELVDSVVEEYTISPETFGLKRRPLEEIGKTESAKQNVQIFEELLENPEKHPGLRDMLLLNSAAALKVSKRVHTFKDGVELASKVLESGCVAETFTKFRESFAKKRKKFN